MAPRPVRLRWVALAVFLPASGVAGYAVAAIAWSEPVWSADGAPSGGVATGVPLHEHAWYRVVLETDCFGGANYTVRVVLHDPVAGETLMEASHPMAPQRRACWSTFATAEFEAPRTGDFDLTWYPSSEIAAHQPRIKVVHVLLPLERALQLFMFSLYGGLNAFAAILSSTVLFGRRPPGRMPTVVTGPTSGVARAGHPSPQ